MKKSLPFHALILLLLSLGAAVSAAPPEFVIDRPGLLDGIHDQHTVYGLNEQGTVAGTSRLYFWSPSSGNTYYGTEAWLYAGGSTIKIGLSGPNYVRADYWRQTILRGINDQGTVIGTSNYYINGASRGSEGWLYNDGSYQNLGLAGADYVDSANGTRVHQPRSINSQDHVIGWSRYYGPESYYSVAWLYNGTSTTAIGLHESVAGWSEPYRLNEQGQVAGRSGTTALWFYNGVSTVGIGLTGLDYDTPGPTTGHSINDLNELGQVTGTSARSAGATDTGQDAFLYNGATSVLIGLTGAGYEKSDGYRYSVTTGLNDLGQVAGYSERYSGTTSMGRDAWFYNGSSTVQLGFIGPGYENSSGYRFSEIGDEVGRNSGLNNQGQAVGYSKRYSGATEMGRDAWLYNGSSLQQLGLTGPGYEDSNGYRYSDVTYVNAQGLVAGYSKRYDGQDGTDAWLYDSSNDEYYIFTLSAKANHAFSQVTQLSDDGVVLGTYVLYGGQTGEAYLGSRAFYFSIEKGLHDLGSLVNDLSDDDWNYLTTANETNNAGHIVGNGKVINEGPESPYILTLINVEKTVSIDVEPNDPANYVQTNGNYSDKMYISIEGNGEFDATQIDSASVKFGPAEASPHTIPGNIVDTNKDGFPDMWLKFRIVDTGLGCGLTDQEVSLTGETHGGLIHFEGTDTVTTEACEAGCHP